MSSRSTESAALSGSPACSMRHAPWSAHNAAPTSLSLGTHRTCRTLLNSSKELRQHYKKPVRASPAAAAELSRPKHVDVNSLVTLAASEQGMAAAAAVLAQQRAQRDKATQRQAAVEQQRRLKLQQWHQEQVSAGKGGACNL
jgi:hypothetical protein